MKGRAHIIKQWLIINQTLLVGITLVGLLTCNNPTISKKLPPAFEKTGRMDSHVVEKVAKTELSRVWFDDSGNVVGIVFLNTQGDFIESRDGVHSGFIRLSELTHRGNENQTANKSSPGESYYFEQ